MQVSLETLTTTWTAFSDITTVDADTIYYFQNRGPQQLLALESASEPSDTNEGVLVGPFETLKYKKGADDLYLRALSGTVSVNISSEG